MSKRIDTFPFLPVKMDAEVREALITIFRQHALQINQLSHDVTRVSSTQAVAVPMVLVDAATANISLTLPPSNSWDDQIIRIKKMDSSANVVNVRTSNSETIDGTLTVSVATQYETLQIFSAGDQWVIV